MKTSKNFWQKLLTLMVLSLLTTFPLFCETDDVAEGESGDDDYIISFGPLTEPHLRMMQGHSWHMKITTFQNAQTLTIDMYKRGDMFAQEVHYEGRAFRTVIRDGKLHVIIDPLKTVYIQDLGDRGAMDLASAKMSFVESGEERFDGRRRTFEEYSDGENRVRYYVDKDKLVGIRQFDDKGKATDIVVVELDRRVPNVKFSIPANYEIKDMSEAEDDFDIEL
jgi:hypothetical protein